MREPPRVEKVTSPLGTVAHLCFAICVSLAMVGCSYAGTRASVSSAAFEPGKTSSVRRDRTTQLWRRLDEFYEGYLKKTGVTGMAVGIVADGELVYGRGFGVRDAGSRERVDVDSVFRIASLTKAFTAAAVLRLRDEGRLALDAPAATYLSELSGVSGPVRDAPMMTVRHLLTNSSGLPFDDSWGPVTFGMADDAFLQMVKQRMILARAPGERYAYSNLGFAILGKIVERISGVPFREYVTRTILQPLHMDSTVWEARDVRPGRLMTGYTRENGSLVPEPLPSDGRFDAAGGLYTSLRDFARYVAFQLAAYPPRDDPESGPLRRSSVRELHEGQRWSRWRGEDVPVAARQDDGSLSLMASSYGYGWTNSTTCDAEGIVHHGGYEPGYFATAHMIPSTRIGIIILATSAPVGFRSFSPALALLREGGLLEPDPPLLPSAALLKAQEQISRLYEKWEDLLARTVFEPSSLAYPWMKSLPATLAELRRDHGTCNTAPSLIMSSRTDLSWRAACERGAIVFTLRLTPVLPLLVQSIEWKDEYKPDDRARAIAEKLMAAVERWDGRSVPELFSASADRSRVRRALLELSAPGEVCKIADPMTSDKKTWVAYRVHCKNSVVDLRFAVDGDADDITDIKVKRLLPPAGTCS